MEWWKNVDEVNKSPEPKEGTMHKWPCKFGNLNYSSGIFWKKTAVSGILNQVFGYGKFPNPPWKILKCTQITKYFIKEPLETLKIIEIPPKVLEIKNTRTNNNQTKISKVDYDYETNFEEIEKLIRNLFSKYKYIRGYEKIFF